MKQYTAMDYPQMKSVSSSTIKELGYDARNGTAFVRFTSGILYAYFDVPEEEFLNLLQAPSIGTYFNKSFKGLYDYLRLK